MANDPKVRRILTESGLVIPDDVAFVGAYHNTCDDGMTYYDLDRLPTRVGISLHPVEELQPSVHVLAQLAHMSLFDCSVSS